jgi:phosphoribosylamine---glycine ligase
MKVLVIGNGGREHAIAWKVAQSRKVEVVYCAPGNGGTAKENKCKNVPIYKVEEFVAFAKGKLIDLTIVGPEVPLIEGIVDVFNKEGLRIFGPSKKGAMLEGSKTFAKDFMKKYGVKTAAYEAFNNIETAKEYIKNCSYPVVIKADGLAAGKGVVICENEENALFTLQQFMTEDIFNGAGKNIVIEEFLEGVEASILSITDGKSIIPFISARDHKQIFDGNRGPNTGGMGAVAPNPSCNEFVLEGFKNDIMIPTLKGIAKEKFDFIGIIFFGIMIKATGVYLLEYNVRMGDPETQAVLALMDSDLVEILEAAVNGRLQEANLSWKKGSACTVVAASGGYPSHYEKGCEITIEPGINSKVFMAGAEETQEKLITTGGRVLALTSVGNTLEEAIEKAYEDIKKVNFKGIYYRNDIGKA